MNKPMYAGFSILEFSKLKMFEHYYDYLKPKYGERIKLCFTDTDSLLYYVKMGDVYKDMSKMADRYDFSGNPEDHFLFSTVNKKTPGTFSDDMDGNVKGFCWSPFRDVCDTPL